MEETPKPFSPEIPSPPVPTEPPSVPQVAQSQIPGIPQQPAKEHEALKTFAGIPLPPMVEKLLPLILAVVAIFFGILIFAVVQKFIEKPEPKPVTIIVTPTPSPTPVHIFTTVATTSAFMAFESNVASLSGKVEAFQNEDPSLTTPSLVLPLGFPNDR